MRGANNPEVDAPKKKKKKDKVIKFEKEIGIYKQIRWCQVIGIYLFIYLNIGLEIGIGEC